MKSLVSSCHIMTRCEVEFGGETIFMQLIHAKSAPQLGAPQTSRTWQLGFFSAIPCYFAGFTAHAAKAVTVGLGSGCARTKYTFFCIVPKSEKNGC